MAQIEGGQEQSSASRPTGWWRRRADLLSKLRSNMLLVAAAGAAALVGAALVTRVLQQSNRSAKFQPRPPRRTHAREGGSENPEDSDVSIPLKEVIRFKERQWFLEELDNARTGDPNAMLRLAKMYLHGQGCVRSIAMASEWVRKARHLGLAATLEELWAGEPEELGRERQRAAAATAAAARLSSAAASA